jgi:large subunit ribosomal protein L19
MGGLLQEVQKVYMPQREFPELKVGNTVRVFYKIVEGEKERVQPFEGVVIRIRAQGWIRPSQSARSPTEWA